MASSSSTTSTVQPPNIITSSFGATSNPISSTTSSDTDDTDSDHSIHLAPRPRLSGRMSSGTNIVPRDHPDIEIRNETFAANDARAMSPRRTSLETEKLGEDTRRSLQMLVFPGCLVSTPANDGCLSAGEHSKTPPSLPPELGTQR